MKKKNWEAPQIKICNLFKQDVITASRPDSYTKDSFDDNWWESWVY